MTCARFGDLRHKQRTSCYRRVPHSREVHDEIPASMDSACCSTLAGDCAMDWTVGLDKVYELFSHADLELRLNDSRLATKGWCCT